MAQSNNDDSLGEIRRTGRFGRPGSSAASEGRNETHPAAPGRPQLAANFIAWLKHGKKPKTQEEIPNFKNLKTKKIQRIEVQKKFGEFKCWKFQIRRGFQNLISKENQNF